jgi:hypothetical protein
MREVPPAIAGKRHGDDLLLRMHLLRELRSGDEKRLPQLWRRTGEPAQAKVNAQRIFPSPVRELGSKPVQVLKIGSFLALNNSPTQPLTRLS